ASIALHAIQTAAVDGRHGSLNIEQIVLAQTSSEDILPYTLRGRNHARSSGRARYPPRRAFVRRKTFTTG
ncbi:MAG: hypothetical protein QGG89_15145, partial [Vicinamibacterales bacterium]|nr:hypothetical protein [Vicinamibacterales bacterium]